MWNRLHGKTPKPHGGGRGGRRGQTGTQRSSHTCHVAHAALCARGGKTERLVSGATAAAWPPSRTKLDPNLTPHTESSSNWVREGYVEEQRDNWGFSDTVYDMGNEP